MNRKRRSNCRRRGAMLVLVAVCLPLFLIMAAFALDIAWMQLVRTELRTATDSASRAGAKVLSLSQDETAARAAAKDAAARNLVAGSPLQVDDADIELGTSVQSTRDARFVFSTGGTQPNAMRVNGNRTASSANGSVSLFLGHVLGVPEYQPRNTAVSTQLDRDICLVIDRSGSMMSELTGGSVPGPSCGPPHPTLSRFGALNTAVAGFVDELDRTSQREQCGLASYSSANRSCGLTYTTSDINSQLDFDYSGIRSEMARLSSQPVQGRTNISAGIDNGILVLTSSRARPFAFKTMVLMTDGRHNTGPEPVISAQRAALDKIVIHTVTFSDEADFARMRAVADATNGQHFHAPTAADLERIFREIAATLPVLVTE